ncbi:DUF429 domain-containing protein [Pedobacter sp. N23S346]|uniref:DUF429 domain-containing protein n=1 Tax=Pedobacter sp. N23S346 TaxID=3402750 RepID=UPI003AD2C756
MSNKAVGIDGCKYGWIAACHEDGTIEIFQTIAEVWDHFGSDCDFLIDMPIGLPSAKIPQRTCEQEARATLPKGRKSSLFPVPCREAFAAETYQEANEMNRRILGKGLTKQTWFIMPKIKELDHLLIRNDQAKLKFKESHPEIAFQFLNAGKPLLTNKKTNEGIQERLQILQKHHPETEQLYRVAFQKFKRAQVAADDILDSLCLSIMQVKIQDNSKAGIRHTFPEKPITDEFGIEMAIYYAP